MNFDVRKGSTSSLVALKAELLNKQRQVNLARASGTTTIKRSSTKKASTNEKSNKGVESRAKLDEHQREDDQEPNLIKSKEMLTMKAKLYEKLSKDKNLLEEDTISEEQSLFLVNFQQKVVENIRNDRGTRSPKHSSDDETPELDLKVYEATNPDEEWVDYLDSFGRTRRCLRKDLPSYQHKDKQLKEKTYSNFVKSEENNQENQSSLSEMTELHTDDEARKQRRIQWEQEEEENMKKSNLHYQDILYQEARQHGVGFYSFSRDEEERAHQMEELDKIRKETESARAQSVQTSTSKNAALNQRLMKVRQRKRQKLGLPPLDEKTLIASLSEVTAEPVPAVEIKEETPRTTIPRPLPKSVKIRPWDMGKEGVPKKPVVSQETWVEKKREERPTEFAPPSIYQQDSRARKKPHVQEKPVISEDSIATGLAFMKQFSNLADPVPAVVTEEEDESNDDDLLPPGESCDARWRPIHRPPVVKKAEIAPPSSMDYYNNSSSVKRKINSTAGRCNVSESFSMGLKNLKASAAPARKDDSD